MRLKRKIKKLAREIDLKKIRMQHLYYESKHTLKSKILSPKVLMASLAGGFLSMYFLLPVFSSHRKKTAPPLKKKMAAPLRHLPRHLPLAKLATRSNAWFLAFTAVQYLPDIIRIGNRLIRSHKRHTA